MRGRRVLSVVVAVLLVAGLGVVGRQWWRVAAIDRHERQWERERPDDYSYRIELICFCFGTREWVVTVEDGRVATVDPDGLDEPRPPTIEELFDVARDAIRDGADAVDVEYSASDGHPTRISVDVISHGVDDEYGYLVHDLEAQP